MSNRNFYRTHADYLRARVKVLQHDIEHSRNDCDLKVCKRLLSKARRELEFGDVEKETTKATRRVTR